MTETSLEDDKAQDVCVIDLGGKTDFADYMVIASGTSRRHINAMTENLRQKIKERGAPGGAQEVSIEGNTLCDWVLIDAGDIVVHLFRPEIREFYNLEKLWGDAGQKCASIS